MTITTTTTTTTNHPLLAGSPAKIWADWYVENYNAIVASVFNPLAIAFLLGRVRQGTPEQLPQNMQILTLGGFSLVTPLYLCNKFLIEKSKVTDKDTNNTHPPFIIAVNKTIPCFLALAAAFVGGPIFEGADEQNLNELIVKFWTPIMLGIGYALFCAAHHFRWGAQCNSGILQLRAKCNKSLTGQNQIIYSDYMSRLWSFHILVALFIGMDITTALLDVDWKTNIDCLWIALVCTMVFILCIRLFKLDEKWDYSILNKELEKITAEAEAFTASTNAPLLNSGPLNTCNPIWKYLAPLGLCTQSPTPGGIAKKVGRLQHAANPRINGKLALWLQAERLPQDLTAAIQEVLPGGTEQESQARQPC